VDTYFSVQNRVESIWTPDTYIHTAFSLTQLHAGALRLRPSGRVSRSRPMIITQQCKRNATDVTNAQCIFKVFLIKNLIWNDFGQVESYAETADRVAYMWLGKDEQEEGVRTGDDPVRRTGTVKEVWV
jgi:hypothetical protein